MRYVARSDSIGGAMDISKPRPLRWAEPSAISRYAIALLSVAMAIVAAELLTRLLHTEPIASSLLCAVLFAAWFGFGPGLLAIALSIFAFHYYLVPPINSFALKHDLFAVDIAELPRLALFSITSIFVNFISLAQRGAKDVALKAEAKAAQAEREIRLVTDTIPALVWRAFPDGAVEYFNQRWLAYTGLTLEQARGWGFLDAYHPEDRESVRNRTSLGIRHEASANDLITEARLRGVDGKYRWFLGRAVALRDEAGNIVRWFGTTIDIEDRKRAEEALRRNEAYLAEAQRLSVTGSFGWRVSSGDIVWSEQTYQIFGLDRAVKPTIDLVLQRVHPDDRDLVRHEVNRVAEGNRDFDVEHRLLMPNGVVKYLHVRSHRVKCESGDDEIVGAMMDITAARAAQEALHAAQAELAHVTRLTILGEMGASIAHEVNQPLAGIVTNAEACLLWLAHGTPNLVEARRNLEMIVKNGNRAGEVIRSIRALSNKADSQRAPLDINDVINDVIALVQRELLSYRVSLRTELAPALPTVLADRVQLQQVIINLVINGIEAMEAVTDRPRELVIRSCQDEADQVSIAVRDRGVGIPAENADRLFGAFVTTKSNGMGMGLSICRSIIQAHGGRIWVVSNLTEGAAFHFTLPSHHEDASRRDAGFPGPAQLRRW
jgi:PAS domain S-box-containing protein